MDDAAGRRSAECTSEAGQDQPNDPHGERVGLAALSGHLRSSWHLSWGKRNAAGFVARAQPAEPQEDRRVSRVVTGGGTQ